jgi:hypothetical protein
MEAAVGQLSGTVHSVLVLVKYSPIGFGGFRLDREKNIPEEELLVLRSILGDGLKRCVNVVVTNWSRQFARINERRLRGITEDQVEKKLQEEMAYSLGCYGCSVYFLDSVFWRTEQKIVNVPNTLPTTTESLQVLTNKILDEEYIEGSSRTSMGQPPDIVQTGQVAQQADSSSEDEAELNQHLGKSRWKNKNYQNLTDEVEPRSMRRPAEAVHIYQKETIDSSSSSSLLEENQSIPIPVRVINPEVSPSSKTSPGNRNRVELSDYIEAKVRQLMDKEGVILDFSDSRLRGKIVTTTKIIKEITAHDGTTKIVEDEEIDEEHFGSELDSISSCSNLQSESHIEDIATKNPLFTMGVPVLSTTFDRRTEDPYHTRERENQHDNLSGVFIRQDSLSSRSSISAEETIEVVHEVLHQKINSNPNLESLTETIVILGKEPNLSHIQTFLKGKSVQNIFTCEVDANMGKSPYKKLISCIPQKANIIFIWTVETVTGEISDDLVWMFGDFIEAFSSQAIENMIVLLWHPGNPEDISGSMQDFTPVLQNNFEYRSSLGFAVLQFRPIGQFYDLLMQKIVEAKSFQWNSSTLQENEPLSEVTSRRSSGQEIPSTVDSPVILMVSPPGHGKSSIGNLLLGAGHFQVRGSAYSDNLALQIASGFCSQGQVKLTCIEAPGIYEDGFDKSNIKELDRHLHSIGYITHILVVWDALEWRFEDLDFVLASIKKIFGVHVGFHLVFAVTFWDQDRKGRKERKKKKITYESISKMIRDRMETHFGLSEEPLIYFLSSRVSSDPSGEYLSSFLASKSWTPFKVDHMKSWLDQLESQREYKSSETDSHDYEDVGRDGEEPSYEKPASTSMHNLAIQDISARNLKETRSQKFGGSMFTLGKSVSSPNKGQPRGKTRGGLRSNIVNQHMAGNLGSAAFNQNQRSKSQGNLSQLNTRESSSPNIVQQKSVDNLYELEVTPSGRPGNTYQENSFQVDSDIDAIERDPYFTPESYNPVEDERRSRPGRRRLVSGSSLSLSGFGKAQLRPQNKQNKQEAIKVKKAKNVRSRSRTTSRSKSRSRSGSRSRSLSPPVAISDLHVSRKDISVPRNNAGNRDRKSSSTMSTDDLDRSSIGTKNRILSTNNDGNIGGSRQVKSKSQSGINISSSGGSRQARARSQSRISLSSIGGSRQAKARSQSRTSLSSIGGSRPARTRSQSRNSLSSLGGTIQKKPLSQSRTNISNVGGSRPARTRSQSGISLSSIGGSRAARPRSQSRVSVSSLGGSRPSRPRSQSRTRFGSIGGNLESRGRVQSQDGLGKTVAQRQPRGRSKPRGGQGQSEDCIIL